MKKVSLFSILLFSFVLGICQKTASSDWTKGILFLKNGDTLSLPLKYDLTNNVIYSHKENKLKIWSSSQVIGFQLIDDEQKVLRKFETLYYEKENGYKVPMMFEALYQDKKYSLYRRDLLSTPSVNYNLLGGLSIPIGAAKVQRFDFYAINSRKEIIWFEPNKKSVLNLFANKKEPLKNYFKEEKIKVHTIEDLIKIFKFYNAL